ncbi:MAG: TIGR00725 family protein [Chloroflexi bacterium]|nr:TIGR00725 family protein [Chloroflexota bacterium]
MIIAVIGGDNPPPEALPQAEAVGRELAQRGHVVICGGRGGVMEAACRGARSAGGHTIGVLPGPDRSDANPHVEFPIVTNLGAARNTIIVLSADALIAVDGSYGTLSEIALALVHGKPVVGLKTWRLSDDAGLEDQSIVRANDATEAVERAIAAAEAVRA